ncbi:hypothetical protein ABEF93_007850 [Exophiala dermatitidis]
MRRILKGHSRKTMGRGVDQLVLLDYMLFMEELLRNASRKARADGEKNIAAKNVRKVTMVFFPALYVLGPISQAEKP